MKSILLIYFEYHLQYDYQNVFGPATLAYPVNLVHDLGQAKSDSVDTTEINWNRIEEYIFKWEPLL